MSHRGRRILLLICPIVFMVSLGVTLVTYAIPYTSHDAMCYAEEHTSWAGHTLYWDCPLPDGRYRLHTLDLGITEEEFEESMQRDVLRKSTIFNPSYISLVEPDDRYVKKVAEHISEMTEGYDDCLRAKAIMNFVQSVIRYDYDKYIYGCDEYPALPLETLYLRKGDCEDSSVLLMSIYIATGYDAILLDYPEHNAVGVRWEGQEDYLYCEASFNMTSEFRDCLDYKEHPPNIYGYEHHDDAHTFHTAIAWYRNTIERTFGV